MIDLSFPTPPESQQAESFREQVRDFLATELAGRTPLQRVESWMGFDAGFSRRLGEQGWIGLTWPKQYGGSERSALERYVLLEELLAAGAPVAAHWIADRQSGPLLLRYGTEAQKQAILPRITRGECFFCIGMSEPDSGSDLAAARTYAEPVDDGFIVNGTKLWTTYGHKAHYMVLFCRTSRDHEDRHGGTSQLLIDLTLPGITIRPIHDLSGAHHFNEVVFENVQVPRDALIGEMGDGWNQVLSELAFERSGPDRYLSTLWVLIELIRALEGRDDDQSRIAVGRLAAHLMSLRRLSRSVAGMLQRGENPTLQAAIVKDLGALLEQEIPDIARQLVDTGRADAAHRDFFQVLHYAVQQVPAFSLRGGTREILRGIIARGLGLR